MYRTVALALLFLFGGEVALSQQPRQAASPSAARTEAIRAMDEAAAKASDLEQLHTKLVESGGQLSKLYSALSQKVAAVGKLAADPHHTHEHLVQAVKDLDAMQMSFNLQYLQLQNAMQNENRSYTAVSNIMKTKHDTVKNSISNIR